MGIGKFPVKFFQVGHQKITADCVTGADSDLSAGDDGICQLIFSALDQVDGRLDVTKQDLSLRGELDPLCAAGKKRLIQLFFQGLYGLAYSGL